MTRAEAFELRRERWRQNAIEVTVRRVKRRQGGSRRDRSVRIEHLDRGEWVVKRGVVNLAWFRDYEEAERFVRTCAP